MRRNWSLIAVFLLAGFSFSHGQSLKGDSMFVPPAVKQYQFNLEKPAEQIENLRYEQSGEPIRGKLNVDGTKVVMDNYKKGQRVKFDAIYPDGSREEVKKSPCYIDQVRYEL